MGLDFSNYPGAVNLELEIPVQDPKQSKFPPPASSHILPQSAINRVEVPKLPLCSSESSLSLKRSVVNIQTKARKFGLVLSSETIETIIALAKEWREEKKRFHNLKREEYHTLPGKAHLFKTPRSITIYVTPKNLPSSEGSTKLFRKSFCVIVPNDDAKNPYSQWVARTTLLNPNHPKSDLAIESMQQEAKIIQEKLQKFSLTCPIYATKRYMGKTGNKFVIYSKLFEANWAEIPTEKLYSIFLQFILGLHEMHREKLFHCDLKKQNMVAKINEKDEYLAALIDFGSLGNVRGQTYSTRAPEYLETDSPTPSSLSEVWALGCAFHDIYYKTTPRWGDLLILYHLFNKLNETVLASRKVPSSESVESKENRESVHEWMDYIKLCISRIDLHTPSFFAMLGLETPEDKDWERRFIRAAEAIDNAISNPEFVGRHELLEYLQPMQEKIYLLFRKAMDKLENIPPPRISIVDHMIWSMLRPKIEDRISLDEAALKYGMFS